MLNGSMPIVYWPLMLVVAYLLGSVPFAQVVAAVKGVDLRKVGTGNVGAGNATSQIGKGWGVAAAILDGLKGLVPVYIARKLGLGPGAAGMVGLSAVVGHNWSFFMKGRSGRGLATSAGAVLAIDPTLMVWTGGWAVAGWKIGGGLAGFLGWGLLPVVSVAMGRPPTQSLFLILLAAVLIGRRMQGNPESSLEPHMMWKRALYDSDSYPHEFPETIEDSLTP
jgi:acyl phosphate:glycerol-3-phosphate acyltransferase